MRHQLTYSQARGTVGSLVSGFASITLQEAQCGLGQDNKTFTDNLQDVEFLHTLDLQWVL